MLDMEERMMKEEDIYDIITELSLPVGKSLVSHHVSICTVLRHVSVYCVTSCQYVLCCVMSVCTVSRHVSMYCVA